MAVNPKLAALVLVVVLAGCGSPGSSSAPAAEVGTAPEVLPYGSALRAGGVQCSSGDAAMRCTDEKPRHSFTLAGYNLFLSYPRRSLPA